MIAIAGAMGGTCPVIRSGLGLVSSGRCSAGQFATPKKRTATYQVSPRQRNGTAPSAAGEMQP